MDTCRLVQSAVVMRMCVARAAFWRSNPKKNCPLSRTLHCDQEAEKPKKRGGPKVSNAGLRCDTDFMCYISIYSCVSATLVGYTQG